MLVANIWNSLLTRFRPRQGCVVSSLDLETSQDCFHQVLIGADDCSTDFAEGFAVLFNVTTNNSTDIKQR